MYMIGIEQQKQNKNRNDCSALYTYFRLKSNDLCEAWNCTT